MTSDKERRPPMFKQTGSVPSVPDTRNTPKGLPVAPDMSTGRRSETPLEVIERPERTLPGGFPTVAENADTMEKPSMQVLPDIPRSTEAATEKSTENRLNLVQKHPLVGLDGGVAIDRSTEYIPRSTDRPIVDEGVLDISDTSNMIPLPKRSQTATQSIVSSLKKTRMAQLFLVGLLAIGIGKKDTIHNVEPDVSVETLDAQSASSASDRNADEAAVVAAARDAAEAVRAKARALAKEEYAQRAELGMIFTEDDVSDDIFTDTDSSIEDSTTDTELTLTEADLEEVIVPDTLVTPPPVPATTRSAVDSIEAMLAADISDRPLPPDFVPPDAVDRARSAAHAHNNPTPPTAARSTTPTAERRTYQETSLFNAATEPAPTRSQELGIEYRDAEFGNTIEDRSSEEIVAMSRGEYRLFKRAVLDNIHTFRDRRAASAELRSMRRGDE